MSGPWVCTPRVTITTSGLSRADPVPVTRIERGGDPCRPRTVPAQALRSSAAARARGIAHRTLFIASSSLQPFNRALYQTQDAAPSVLVPEIRFELSQHLHSLPILWMSQDR